MNTFTSRFERAHVSEGDRCRSTELGALRWRFRGLSERPGGPTLPRQAQRSARQGSTP